MKYNVEWHIAHLGVNVTDLLFKTGRLVVSADEHNQLIAAMRARDRTTIRWLMTTHIKHTRGLWAGWPEHWS